MITLNTLLLSANAALLAFVSALFFWGIKLAFRKVDSHKDELKESTKALIAELKDTAKEIRQEMGQLEKFIVQAWGEIKEISPRVTSIEQRLTHVEMRLLDHEREK